MSDTDSSTKDDEIINVESDDEKDSKQHKKKMVRSR